MPGGGRRSDGVLLSTVFTRSGDPTYGDGAMGASPTREEGQVRPLGRMRFAIGALALLTLLLASTDSTRLPAAASPGLTIGTTELTGGWALRAADEVSDPGDSIATVGYPTTGWHPVTLPSTVL